MLYDPKWEVPAEVKLEPWQQILKDAADIIEREGWIRDSYHNKNGHCAIGAINKASKLNGKKLSTTKAVAALHKIIFPYSPSPDMKEDIITWNDHYLYATKQTVIDILRKAAGV